MDPNGLICQNYAILKCGGSAGKCFMETQYLPVCALICLPITKNIIVCTVVCGAYTAYSIVKCIIDMVNCPDNAMKECCSKPENSGDASCECWKNKN